MYKSTFMGLNSALSGVLSSQIALDTTANNIANVDNEGYKRQRVQTAGNYPWTAPSLNGGMPSQIGTGTLVQGVVNLSDRIAEQAHQSALSDSAQAQATLTALTDIENVLGEPGEGGLSAELNRFFQAMEDVQANPSDMAARQVMLQAGSSLSTRLNQIDQGLTAVDQGATTRLGQITNEVNRITQRIATLNEEIRESNIMGQNPNHQETERTQLLNELSEYIDFQESYSSPADEVTITFGFPAVNIVDPAIPAGYNAIAAGDITTAYGGGTLTSGEAFALEELRAVTLPNLRTQLNNLTADMVNVLNTQHQAGFDLNGAAGGDFFLAGGTTIGTIAMDPATMGDPRLIAAADSWAGGGEPNNSNNLNLMLIERDTVQGAPVNATWESYYQSSLATIGTAGANARRDVTGTAARVLATKDRVESVSGVNIEEEMTNMIRFQHAYNASARVLTTMDEMLDTLINRMGRVGI